MLKEYARTSHSGLRVSSLRRESGLYLAGLRKKDIVLSVNDERVTDELDFAFYAAAPTLRLGILRGGKPRTIDAKRRPGSFLAVGFFQKPIRRCANRCIFCFIDQMPPGLRGPLYIKDEDLSHSFLNGNYVTLSNTSRATLLKIAAICLSPLFISVHATDPLVRLKMLGIKKAIPIMEQLRFLKKNNIAFHTQIVVCPGYNDGETLKRTIQELLSLGKSLLSIAVVPVGLTRFRRRFPLPAVTPENAQNICRQITAFSNRDAVRSGKRRLFLADEFFQKAGEPIPCRNYYEDYPQIENGVGLLRLLFEEWSKAAKQARHKNTGGMRRTTQEKKYLVVTSLSALPSIRKIARACERLRPGVSLTVEAAANRFFGDSVTVAGLLTARDVVRTIRTSAKTGHYDGVLLPKVMFNYAGFTLDGWSTKRLAKKAGTAVSVLSSIQELLFV